MCWLDEKVFEGQIRSLKENQNWDVYNRLMAREEVGTSSSAFLIVPGP